MLPATSPLVQQRISYATQVSASFISLSRVIKRALGSNVRKSSKVQGPYVALSEQQKAPHREARKAPAGKRHVAQSATREAPLTWCPSQVLLCECNELCDNQYQQMRCRSVESTVHVHARTRCADTSHRSRGARIRERNSTAAHGTDGARPPRHSIIMALCTLICSAWRHS